MDKLTSELLSFLLKEVDAPCSAESHLNSALFSVIDTYCNDSDLEKILQDKASGFYAILECANRKYRPLPQKYQKFYEEFNYLESDD